MDIDSFYYLDIIRKIVVPMPATEEYTCFGTPAFRTKKKLLARMKEDGKTLAVHSEERESWIRYDPQVFFITDHYRNYPMVLVNLPVVKPEDLQRLLLDAWKQIAPKRLLNDYEEKRGGARSF